MKPSEHAKRRKDYHVLPTVLVRISSKIVNARPPKRDLFFMDKQTVSRDYLNPPHPAGQELAMFGMGCFWGAERMFWQTRGVLSTAVGYAAGHSPNPDYEAVCSGETGHNEVVQVVFDAGEISYEALLGLFWENHDPTQGMRQGNDVGSQYRSAIYVYGEAQRQAAFASRERYQAALNEAGHDRKITTEISSAPHFYRAESYHQHYLAKNPAGYCGLGGTGVRYPQATQHDA